MKKFQIILMALFIIFAMSGCKENISENPDEQISQIENNKRGFAVKTQIVPEHISNLTEVASYMGDTDGDGADETIVLATSAERDLKDEFLWNDGQKWALYVKDSSDEVHILVDKYVQAGKLYFEVADYYIKEGTVPVITVFESTGAGMSIKSYTFRNEKSAYEESVVFDTKNVTDGGINKRFSSFPDIVK